jgi:hypothetical protein
MPGVNSITPYNGTFVPNNQTLLQRVVRNAKREIGLAHGGAARHPSPEEMRIEMMERRYATKA